MKVLAALALLTLAAISLPPDAHAVLKVFGAGVYVTPLSSSDVDFGGGTDAVEASSEFGYNFGVELHPLPLIGIELDYAYAKQDIETDAVGVIGSTAFKPICGTLNVYLPVLPFSLHGGPTAAYVDWSDLELENGPSQEMDSEFAWGFSAGAEVPIFPRIALIGGLRWLSLSAQPDDSDKINVDPLFVRLGAAVKL